MSAAFAKHPTVAFDSATQPDAGPSEHADDVESTSNVINSEHGVISMC